MSKNVCVCVRARVICKSVQTRAKLKKIKKKIIWCFKIKKHDYPYNLCTQWNPKRHTKISKRHFIMNMVCTHNTKHSSMHKNEEQTRKICRTSIITKPTKPYSTTIFPYLNIYTKSKKTRVRNLKYIENKRKTHTISWRLMKKIEVLWVTMEVLGEGEADKTRCVNMMRGKTEKFLKTV